MKQECVEVLYLTSTCRRELRNYGHGHRDRDRDHEIPPEKSIYEKSNSDDQKRLRNETRYTTMDSAVYPGTDIVWEPETDSTYELCDE